MSGGRLLTYKRKRHFVPDTIPQESGYPLLSADSASYKTSNVSDKNEELGEANNTGNSAEGFEVKKQNFIYIYMYIYKSSRMELIRGYEYN